ncbi:hypothetical protein D9M70_614160 [compost metagenome]
MINTDGPHRKSRELHGIQDILPDRIQCFGTQALNISGGIIARQRGEVDTGYRPEQPGRLMLFFDGSAGRERGSPALHSRTVNIQVAETGRMKG